MQACAMAVTLPFVFCLFLCFFFPASWYHPHIYIHLGWIKRNDEMNMNMNTRI